VDTHPLRRYDQHNSGGAISMQTKRLVAKPSVLIGCQTCIGC
jgi:hypothetical protein